MECIYSDPINLGTEENPQWQYSKITCEILKEEFLPIELIHNTSTEAEFYAQKTLTYGEATIIWFLTMFTIYFIIREVFNFFQKK